jgi:AcrR family transcriptional regulator
MARPKGQTLSQQDVVNAAIRCLQQDGESGLGVNRVAHELGIRPPSIYKHIDGNDALRRAVAIEGMHRLTEYLSHQVEGIQDNRHLVRAIAYGIRQFFHDHPALHNVITTTPIDDDPGYESAKQAFLAFNAEHLQPFGIEGDDMIHAVRALVSACHGFVLLERSQRFTASQSLDDSYEWLISALIFALESRQFNNLVQL